MNKLLKSAFICAIGLIASPVVFGATTTQVVTSPAPSMTTTASPTTTVAPATTVTVTKTGPMGYHVCYRPMSRQVQASRTIERCGGYAGCQTFRVTRTFNVSVYSNCHWQTTPCSSNGFARFGFYPTKDEAHYAIDRCQHTIMGQLPAEWRVTY
jgi:hypothetical protein